MAWGMLIAAAYSAYDQSQAGEEGDRLSAANSRSLYAEATETIRKTKLSQNQILSETQALSGASGVSMKSKTVITYLDEMKANFKKDIDWMEQARSSGLRLEQQKGANIRRQANAAAFGTFAQGVASAVDK